MSSNKYDRKWTMAAGTLALACIPVAALALGGGNSAYTAAAAGCAAPGMKPLEPTAETVKGAPYSGVGTTEVVTTLPDGKRVTRTNTMHYFRDSAGRMRTEYQLGAIGPFVPEESQKIVTITDPVAGKRYVLHPSQKHADVFDLASEKGATARAGKAIVMSGAFTSIAAPAFGLTPSPAPAEGIQMPHSNRGGAQSGFSVGGNTSESGGGRSLSAGGRSGGLFFGTASETTSPPAEAGCTAANGEKAPQAVSMGERRIEGLKVTGSRLEFTIKPGEAGNEQPITVRTDQWFSPELGVVVASTHNDPMIGETTYRLEQIDRSEPDAALFTVPKDYSTTGLER